MQPKHFNLLALAAIISLVAASLVHSAYNSFDDEVVSGQRLFPSLERDGNKTAQIAIQKGGRTLTIKKAEDGKHWGLVERAGYPAKPLQVRDLVVKLSQTELVDKKTRNEDLYGQLDLGDPAKKDANAAKVRLADESNATIAEIVIGKQRREAFGTGKTGTYVRVPGDPQTWLAKLDVNTSLDVSDWVEPAFFAVDGNKMKSVTVKRGDEVVYKLVVEDEGKTAGQAGKDAKGDQKIRSFKVADVPTGKAVKKGIAIDEMVNGVRTLELIDVRAAAAADAKPDMTAEVVMDDGVIYTIGLNEEGEDHWLTVSTTGGENDEAVKELAEKTKGWAFKVPGWRADQTFKKADEVFETVAVEKSEGAPAAEPARSSAPAGMMAPRRSSAGAMGTSPLRSRSRATEQPASPDAGDAGTSTQPKQ